MGFNRTAVSGLTGTWYDNYLNRYEMDQSGNAVTAVVFTPTNEYLGEVEGVLSGNRLTCSYETVLDTSGSGVGTLQPDGLHMDSVAADDDSGLSETNRLHRGHLPNSGY